MLKGLRKTTTNIQVVGFCDSDTYEEVLAKGAKALNIEVTLMSCNWYVQMVLCVMHQFWENHGVLASLFN